MTAPVKVVLVRSDALIVLVLSVTKLPVSVSSVAVKAAVLDLSTLMRLRVLALKTAPPSTLSVPAAVLERRAPNAQCANALPSHAPRASDRPLLPQSPSSWYDFRVRI